MDTSNMIDVVEKLIKVTKDKEDLKKIIGPKIDRLASIYASVLGDAYRYVEDWEIENSIIHIETVGYRFGEVNNYYQMPLDYIYKDEDVISDMIKKEEERKRELRSLEKQKELERNERKEYDRLKNKFES